MNGLQGQPESIPTYCSLFRFFNEDALSQCSDEALMARAREKRATLQATLAEDARQQRVAVAARMGQRDARAASRAQRQQERHDEA